MRDTDFAALADAGWPALERTEVGGWIARFADGVTQRANSVYPAGAVDDPETAIDDVERLYRLRGLAPRFQLADQDASLEAALVGRGYLARDETLVLAADLHTVAEALARSTPPELPRPGPAPVVAVAPDDEWLDLWWSVDGRGGDAQRAVARRILTGGPAVYATIRDESGAASVGRLAVVEQHRTRWGGLYAIATRPDARRRGLARAVIDALVQAAGERDVTALWLQVLASNDAALTLYERLGFARVAAYRYLKQNRRAEPAAN